MPALLPAIVVFLSTLLCAGCHRKLNISPVLNEPAPTRALYDVKGPVKKVIVYQADNIDQTEFDSTRLYTIAELEAFLSTRSPEYYPDLVLIFEKGGQLAEKRYFAFECMANEDINDPAGRDVYSYNPKGDMKRIDIYGHGLLQYQYRFEYDAESRLQKKEYICHKWESEAIYEQYDFTYDTPLTIVKNGDFFIPYTEKAFYDADGCLVEEFCVDQSGNPHPLSRVHNVFLNFQYDKMRKDNFSRIIVGSSYKYNDNRQLTARHDHLGGGDINREEYSYDESGRLSEKHSFLSQSPSAPIRSTYYEYRDSDDIVFGRKESLQKGDELLIFNLDHLILEERTYLGSMYYVYKYDHYGNWILCFSWGTGEATEFYVPSLIVRKREIEYFNDEPGLP